MKAIRGWLAAPPHWTLRSVAWTIYVVWMSLSIITDVGHRHFYVAWLEIEVIALLLFVRWMMAEIDRQNGVGRK
jgi:hypothetical protein